MGGRGGRGSGGLVESEIRVMTECKMTLATALDATSGSTPPTPHPPPPRGGEEGGSQQVAIRTPLRPTAVVHEEKVR